jgi:hypothetical protein
MVRDRHNQNNGRDHEDGQDEPPRRHRLRDEVDLDTLTRELLTVVDQTMGPAKVSLWLRSTRRQPAGQPDQASRL